MPELIHLPFSPWSEKARWALELCGVQYASREYVPLFGELELRRLLQRWQGPVTVPVLCDGDRVFSDSYSIACYAQQHGGKRTLFPKGQEARIAHYSELSEQGLAAGRALALARMLTSPAALREVLPSPLRRAGVLSVAFGRAAIRRTYRKYEGHLSPAERHEQVLSEVLETLRADLASSPSSGTPKTLLAELSYADVAMAQVVACLRPPSLGLRLGRAMRSAFEHPRLAERYLDLVAWRDALYARYRSSAS